MTLEFLLPLDGISSHEFVNLVFAQKICLNRWKCAVEKEMFGRGENLDNKSFLQYKIPVCKKAIVLHAELFLSFMAVKDGTWAKNEHFYLQIKNVFRLKNKCLETQEGSWQTQTTVLERF